MNMIMFAHISKTTDNMVVLNTETHDTCVNCHVFYHFVDYGNISAVSLLEKGNPWLSLHAKFCVYPLILFKQTEE